MLFYGYMVNDLFSSFQSLLITVISE